MIDYHANESYLMYDESNYSEVHWTLSIKRRPNYYVQVRNDTKFCIGNYTFKVLGLPTFIITTLAIFGLFAPFSSKDERQEKVSMGLTTMLSMSIIVMVIGEALPKTSKSQPLLGAKRERETSRQHSSALYILGELTISAIAVIVSMFVLILQRQALNGQPPPKLLVRCVYVLSSLHC